MLPPSTTEGRRVGLEGAALIGAVTDVAAGAGLMASCSKLPPVPVLTVADTLPASTYTSSLGAATLTVPELAPAAMVMVAPLDSVTVTGLCAAAVRLAV